MVDGDGQELYLPPHLLESVDEWGVVCGILLEPLVAPKVLAESDLDNDEDALLAVEGVQVRRWGVWYSSDVDQVGGGAVSLPE